MVTSHLVNPLLALLVGAASAIPAPTPQEFHAPPLPGDDGSWNLAKFTSLVAFGDSYTDESRLAYFIATGGQAPPVGWIGPEVRTYHDTSNKQRMIRSRLLRVILLPPVGGSGPATLQIILGSIFTTMRCLVLFAPTNKWTVTFNKSTDLFQMLRATRSQLSLPTRRIAPMALLS